MDSESLWEDSVFYPVKRGEHKTVHKFIRRRVRYFIL